MNVAPAFFASLLAFSFAAVAGAAPVPSASPSAPASSSPAASPAASPAPTPTISMLPPDAPPQILWVQFSSLTPTAGDVISEVVLTSSNVASVEVRVGSYGWNLPKTDVGHFEGSYTVPHLPFFVSHNLVVLIIARNTAGAAAQSSVAMQIR